MPASPPADTLGRAATSNISDVVKIIQHLCNVAIQLAKFTIIHPQFNNLAGIHTFWSKIQNKQLAGAVASTVEKLHKFVHYQI